MISAVVLAPVCHVSVFTREIYAFCHKSAIHVKNHIKSCRTPKFTAIARIHGFCEHVICLALIIAELCLWYVCMWCCCIGVNVCYDVDMVTRSYVVVVGLLCCV